MLFQSLDEIFGVHHKPGNLAGHLVVGLDLHIQVAGDGGEVVERCVQTRGEDDELRVQVGRNRPFAERAGRILLVLGAMATMLMF